MHALSLTEADWLAIERESCKRSLVEFTQRAWSILEPSQPYVHGWHMDAIADHLEAITAGHITRLLINVPPGMMKSMSVCVFWPAWEWGPRGMPSMRFIGASHEENLAIRDNVKMRRLVQSPWYQRLWPTKMAGDQNAKTYFENERTGWRQACPVRSMTGRRGDRVVWDDPHSVEDAHSDAGLEEANRVFRETLPTRLNSPEHSAIIVVMQRLSEKDVSGVILSEQFGYEHLCLPMEFEAPRKATSTGFEDPRREVGELLFPARFPRAVVDRDKKIMGAYATAGQFQQRPSPARGGEFETDKLEVVDALPAAVTQWCRGWDLAATEGAGDYTAGVKVGRMVDGRFVVAAVVREQFGTSKRDALIKATADSDGAGRVKQSLPQDPGSAGKPIWEKELILMADGSLRPLENVSVGNFVIGADGAAHEVTHVHEQGSLPTVTITTDSGRSAVAALDHPFLTPEGWVEAGKLNTGDALALRSRPRTTVASDRSPQEFRLAGYFVGDGAVGRAQKAGNTGSCHAEFTCADSVQLADFIECVESIGGSVVRRARNVQFGTKGLQNWLRATDIAGHTAYDKRVPPWVFGGSVDQVSHFLGAYFACDGTISKSGDEIVYYSVSRALLEDVQHLLLRLGISSTIKRKNGKYLETRHESWLLRMRHKDDGPSRFAKRIPLFHGAKSVRIAALSEAAKFRRFDEEFIADQIASIEPSGDRPCRCLTVAGSHTFLVRDIVVHNSQVLALVSMLAGHQVHSSTETGEKVVRARPFASQVNAGNVLMLKGAWNTDFTDELQMFPNGLHDDQADAAARAFNGLIGPQAGVFA